jgi:hypothetical protein
MQEKLTFQVSKATALTSNEWQALIDLCTAADKENFDHLLEARFARHRHSEKEV